MGRQSANFDGKRGLIVTIDNLQTLRSSIQGRGIATDVEFASDGGRQLTVLAMVNGELKRALSIAPRPEGVIILGFRGCFRLDDHADVVETIIRLADRMLKRSDTSQDLEGVQPYPFERWLDDGRRRVAAEREAGGWSQLAHARNRTLWEEFTERFAFRRSITLDGWPAIKEIDPSVTWTVTTVQEMYDSDREHFVALERQSREQLICTFEAVGDRMYALDLNHDGYSFVPGTVARLGMDVWPIRVIPVHNYSLFIDPSFSFGLLAHPWEASICVFGHPLVNQLVLSPLACFGEVIRSSSHSNP